MRLRVVTYNIHKCIGGVDRRYDPTRLVSALAEIDADVLLLQEVDAEAKRSNRDRQVDVLGDALGLPHRTWFANVNVRGGGAYGNAVLSRYPIEESCNIDITVGPKKRRSIVHATLRVRSDERSRTVHVFNMHLGLAEFERKLQLKKFLSYEPMRGMHATTPILVGGDFNDVWGGLGQLLVPAGFAGVAKPPATFPAWGPVRALDSIYVRGAEMKRLWRSETALAKRASDHRPLAAEIEFPDDPDQPVADAVGAG